MNLAIMRTTFAVALVLLVLTATGLWAAGAEEDGSGSRLPTRSYVIDPTTGKPVVSAPEYGGTITYTVGQRLGLRRLVTRISASSPHMIHLGRY